MHPEDRDRARNEIQAYLSKQKPVYQLEHRLRHKDGSYRWILARAVVLRDTQGKPLRMSILSLPNPMMKAAPPL